MRALMSVVKNRHGVYVVRKKVPPRLSVATAKVLGNGKARQSWLQRSLGTKDLKEANRRAKAVLIEFDRTLDQAECVLKPLPVRQSLSKPETERIADYHYATALSNHEAAIRDARQIVLEHARSTGAELPSDTPQYGLSPVEHARMVEGYRGELATARSALALGDIAVIIPDVEEALAVFGIRLEPGSASYRDLAISVLRNEVRARETIESWLAGNVVDVPPQPTNFPTSQQRNETDTLSVAIAGGKGSDSVRLIHCQRRIGPCACS